MQPTLVSHFFSTDRHGYSWACIAAIMRQAQAINQDLLHWRDIRISRSGPCNGNLGDTATAHTAFLDVGGRHPKRRPKSQPIPIGHILIHVEGWVEKE